jgi:lysophospholipase L1-like esterase
MASARLISNTAAKGQSIDAVSSATGTSQVTNYAPDPNVLNGSTSWGKSGQPAGGTWTGAVVTNGSADGTKNVWRETCSVQSTATGTNTGPAIGLAPLNTQSAYRVSVTPGQVWSFGIRARCSAATNAYVVVNVWSGPTTLLTTLQGSLTALPANTEVDLKGENLTIPATAVSVTVTARAWQAQDVPGSGWFEVSRARATLAASVATYFDGDDANAKWVGTRGISASKAANVDLAGAVVTQINAGVAKPAILSAATNGSGKRTFTNECQAPIASAAWTANYGTAGTGTTTYPTVAAFLTALAAVNGTRTYTHLPTFPAGETVQLMQWTGASSQTGSDTGPSSGPNGAAARFACVPGDIVSGSIFVGSSIATGVRAAIEFYTSAGAFITRSLGPMRTFVAGDAYRLHVGSGGSPTAAAPANAAFYTVMARPDLVSTFGSTGFLGIWGAQTLHGYQAQPYRNGNHQDAAWSGTTGTSASPAHLTVPTRKIAVLGDSMVQLAQDGGNPLPDHLAWKLGCECHNLGRGGETTTGMAIRYGALPVMVTVTGGSIPTSGSVNVTVDRATTERDDALWAFYGTLAGVPGTLSRPAGATSSGNSWFFTPFVYPASALAVPAPMPWRSTMGADYSDITVVIGGNNNYSVATGQSYMVTDIVRDYKAVRTRVRANGGRLLILSAYPNSGGTTGTQTATDVANINAALATEFGAEYLDLLSLMRSTGALAVAGITPTTGDNTDIANGVIPRDLMQVDGIHPNETGRDVEAFFIAQYILAMDWLTAG